MKKRLLALAVCLLLLASCKGGSPQPERVEMAGSASVSLPDADTLEIREKMFIAQINDIYLNPEDYMGKTLKYEGIFDIYHESETQTDYHYVIRFGPGCCGTDGNAGFEVFWEGELPRQDDWVEVVGVLDVYTNHYGFEFLCLRISSLTVLSQRGAEYLTQ